MQKNLKIYKKCLYCKTEFYTYLSTKRKFCSHKCYWNSKIGKKLSEKTKQKIRIFNIGRKHTEKAKQKMRKNNARYWLGKKHSKETKDKISLSHVGKKHRPMSIVGKRNIADAKIGTKHSVKTKNKMIETHKKNGTGQWMLGRTGKRSNSWKGEKCKVKEKRNDSKYQWWVKQVKKRDNNICWLYDENCEGYNIVHHIFPWRKYPKLRYELTNGITLCQYHHPRGRDKEELFRKLFSYLVEQK